MGKRGPVPKRSEERRRRNKPKAKAVKPRSASAKKTKRPPVDRRWHRLAQSWYCSLSESGQSQFYEASDWQLARLIAENLSRDLKPKVVSVIRDTGRVVYAEMPLKGASIAAYLQAMTALMVSEGDRRRAGIELQRGGPPPEKKSAGVTALDDYRKRLGA